MTAAAQTAGSHATGCSMTSTAFLVTLVGCARVSAWLRGCSASAVANLAAQLSHADCDTGP